LGGSLEAGPEPVQGNRIIREVHKAMRKTLGLIVAGLFVASCASWGPSDARGSTETPYTPPIPLQPTVCATSTPSLPATQTHAETPTPRIPTRTLSPTLSAAQENDYWMELLRTNADCQLPCWLGLTPGSATYSDFDLLFAPVGAPYQVYSPSSEGTWRQREFIRGEDGNPLLFSVFRERGGSIYRIDTQASGPNQCSQCFPQYLDAIGTLSLQAVLRELGTPSRVLLSMYTGPTERGAPWWYFLWLLYDDRGVSVSYEGEGLLRIDEAIRVCPRFQDVFSVYLTVIGPPDKAVFDHDIQDILRSGGPPLLAIEEATSLDPDDFHSRMLEDSGTACFTTPIDVW
jgi:hypothetical protein